MGISALFPRKRGSSTEEISIYELYGPLAELQIRNIAYWTCVSMISNAVSKCEFVVLKDGAEVHDEEYYLWNIQPNVNQNSTAFLQKLIATLYMKNEALIVEKPRSIKASFYVADDWDIPQLTRLETNRYNNVRIENITLPGTLRESDVMHFTLNAKNMQSVVNGFYDCYKKIIDAAMKGYKWRNGQHWKVHISQVAQGQDGWKEALQKMLSEQFKTFLDADGAVLPEFDGYLFESVGNDRNRSAAATETRDIRSLVDDVFDMTARAFMIPPVLLTGNIADSKDAFNRWLTLGIDPLCDNLQEEINRKRFSFEEWQRGNSIRIDTSKISHFDIFQNAANIEKLVGSGYSYNAIQKAAGGVEIDEEWADAHLFTKNFATAEDLLTPVKGGEQNA